KPAVRRMDALKAWWCWGAKALSYDNQGLLTTAVGRKVVSLH
ncbi:hypothetical protein A2U01_0087010, partial [Trifolium medium]|nr:hypothetical protein [Trifolium medium]